MTGKNAKRPQHERDHHGLVPLPVKVCYTCNRYAASGSPWPPCSLHGCWESVYRGQLETAAENH